MPEILVEVTRGPLVESLHRGDIAVVRSDGKLLYRLGKENHLCYMRSAAKPIQAVCMLKAGIKERFGLTLREIALLMSSHSGEKTHTDILNGMLGKIGIEEKSLHCGATQPLDATTWERMAAAGEKPQNIHCACSGKHIGQIATAIARGYSIEDYDSPSHAIQQELLRAFSDFCGVPANKIAIGIDGCGVPVYGIPLERMALCYAHLCDPSFMQDEYAAEKELVQKAMTGHPEMIGGSGRFDTELMRCMSGTLVAKFGNEGIYCAGLPEKGVGIAIKIEDGNRRAIPPVVLSLLRQISVASEEKLECLKAYENPLVFNNRGEPVGILRPAFKLEGPF